MGEIDIKTPDFYVKNHGVEVKEEKSFPESGRVSIKIQNNAFQAQIIQVGLEQAKELHEKLGQTISSIEGL